MSKRNQKKLRSDIITIDSEENLSEIDASKSTKTNVTAFNKKDYYTFYKKADALKKLKSGKRKKLKLFSEDTSKNTGSKKFIVSTYDNIYALSMDRKHNMYENYENGQELKLILDIDYKIKSKKSDTEEDKFI